MTSYQLDDTAVLLGQAEDECILPDAWRQGESGVCVITPDDATRATEFRRLFVVAEAIHLPRVAKAASAANRLNRLAGLFVRLGSVAPEAVCYLFDQANLRVLRHLIIHEGHEVPGRVFRALELGAPADFIAAAYLMDDKLLVYDCTLRSHVITFDAYPALAAIPPGQRAAFCVEEDGYLLHWPDADVHLDLDAIRHARSPEAVRAARLAQVRENRDLGRAVRDLRKQHRLTQNAIPGLSARHLGRIESGNAYLTDDALDTLASAHGMSSDAYFNAVTALLPPPASVAGAART